MTKILSIVLSFTILFTSIAPSYGQALDSVKMRRAQLGQNRYEAAQDNTRVVGVERKRMAMDKALEQAQVAAMKSGSLPLEVREVLEVLEGTVSEKEEYKVYKEQYKKYLAGLLAEALGAAQGEEARAGIKARYEELVKEEAIKQAYEQDKKELEGESAAEGEAYIKDLVERIYEVGQESKASVMWMVEEALPVFSSMGLVKPEIKRWAAGLLREKVNQQVGNCGALGFWSQMKGGDSERGKKCEGVLKAAGALIVLGEGGRSADAAAIAELLKQGKKGAYGSSIIMTAGAGLLSMGAVDYLVAAINEEAQRKPDVGLLGEDFSFITLQDWVKASKATWENGAWATGYEYSFYKGEGKALENAWTDLGEYIGQQSVLKGAEGAPAREVLSRVAGLTIGVNSKGGVNVLFPVFMAGAIAGGYKVPSLKRSGTAFGGNGQVYNQDNSTGWNRLEGWLKKNGLTLTGYVAMKLYYNGKSDLDPYTKLAVNNKLVKAYKKSGSSAKIRGMEERTAPTAQELKTAEGWKRASDIAGGIDIVAVVVGMVALGSGLVKAAGSGARLVAQMGRTFKVARAGAAGRGLKATAQAYRRVVRLGLTRKYGTSNIRQIFITQLRGSRGLKAAAKPTKTTPVEELTPAQKKAIRAQGEEWLNAQREIEAQKRLAEQARAQARLAKEQEIAAAMQAERGPAVAGFEIAPQRAPAYRQTVVRNALGQEVLGWESVKKPVVKKPSLWKHFKDGVNEWSFNVRHDIGTTLQEGLSALRRGVAAAYVATSMMLTPVASSGMQGLVRVEQGLNSLVRTEQVFSAAAKMSRGAVTVSELSNTANTVRGVASGVRNVGEAVRATQGVRTLSGVGQTTKAASPNLLSSIAKWFGLRAGARSASAPLAGGLLSFSPVAVTPREERALGLGNFFKRKTGKPQFIVNYLKEVDLQEKLLGKENPELAEFNALQSRKAAYNVAVNQTQQYWARQGYPITGKIQSLVQHGLEGAYLYGVAPILQRNNPYYQEYERSVEEYAQQTTQQTAPTAAQQSHASKSRQDLLGEQIPVLSAGTLVSPIQKILNQNSVYSLGIIHNDPLAKRVQNMRNSRKYAATIEGLLKEARRQAVSVFMERYGEELDFLNRDERFIQIYEGVVQKAIEESQLPQAVKTIAFSRFQEALHQPHHSPLVLQKESAPVSLDAQPMMIPVYDTQGKYLKSVPVTPDSRFKINSRQEVFIVAQTETVGEMYVREYKNENRDDSKTLNILVRSDIPLNPPSAQTPTSAFGMKKIVEGILMINNRVWPMFGLYLLAGMGNLSTVVSTFAQESFSLTNFDLYLMGGVSSVAMGLLSLVAGILQNRWSYTKKGFDDRRGRLIMTNLGFATAILSFALPWVIGGMGGDLGVPVEWKKNLLITSFIFLGISGAFLDVSMKPTLLAVSKRGDYQSRVGYLSVFKQTVGNMSNYVVPPIAMGIAVSFGSMCDWTIFFPIYTVVSIGIAVLYNIFRMHEQTLEVSEEPREKTKIFVKSMFKHLVGKSRYDRLIRRGVIATAFHGANMSIIGLFVNLLVKNHYPEFKLQDMYAMQGQTDGFFGVIQRVWEVMSNSWLGYSLLFFTVPIILGRFLGTFFMRNDINLFGLHINRQNNGSLLQKSVILAAVGIVAMNSGIWAMEVAGIVLLALGLTNISPIINGYTTDQTRQDSNAVSSLLSASTLISFCISALFGLFLDLFSFGPWLAFILPISMLGFLYSFGRDIESGRLEGSEEEDAAEQADFSDFTQQDGPDMNNPLPN